MATGEEKSKTSVQGTGTVVKGKYGPECYFHPGSATLLFLEASDTKIIEQEHDFLSGLLETQKQAQKILMILILKQSLRQAECQQENLKVKSLKPMKP
ncbi:TPA: hypothetical protein RRT58_000210 [Klebsiella pneumoniae]|jgi:hypothetical protein|nr:hypothetical protein [Klebsiella pneumoniae subsp. ozaenae]HDZ0760351.1 hypothetical protein [Klebsiella pneumoniae]